MTSTPVQSLQEHRRILRSVCPTLPARTISCNQASTRQRISLPHRHTTRSVRHPKRRLRWARTAAGQPFMNGRRKRLLAVMVVAASKLFVSKWQQRRLQAVCQRPCRLCCRQALACRTNGPARQCNLGDIIVCSRCMHLFLVLTQLLHGVRFHHH